MSDLISREALCEYALNQKDKSVTPNDIMRFPSAQPKKRTENTRKTHACDCIDQIDREPTIEPHCETCEAFNKTRLLISQPQQRWIPCSKELPEKGQKCLVCDKGAIAIDTFIGNGKPYDWKWYMRDYEAWMALPEPYREEGE